MENELNRRCKISLLILLFLAVLFLLCDCGYIRLDTNLPLQTTRITFINNTNSPLSFLIDGVEKVVVSPAQTQSFGYWVGGGAYQWSIQVSVTVLDRKSNQSWSDVVYFSSYYRYSYVFTAREDENRKLYVERRN
jgi:hypothetical protein